MKRTRTPFLFFRLSAAFSLLVSNFLSNTVATAPKDGRRTLKSFVQGEDFAEESSLWESDPIEIDSVKIQILDKISGKVYRESIKLNYKKKFRSIELELKRCFKNSPEDEKEISAFVEITENGNVVFSNWLFASSPSINLFSHPIYDIRIEF
ncbi:MAG: DUF2155 domain-containing protein [Holosporaceae bacterium]|jgi:hypothetical protein|nr:DUF2155 domain-containing protein [Holosporaceae bacterium]